MTIRLKWVAGALILAGFLWITAKGTDPDLFWHLRVGQWIVEQHAVPHIDEYSYTMKGHTWVDHEWSQEAFLWWAHSRGGWPLAVTAFSLLAFVPFAVWLKRATSVAHVGIIILGATVASRFIGVRPQMVSFMLFFILYELLVLRRESSGVQRTILSVSLPLLFLAWANVHAGFAGGLILFGACIVGDALSGGVKKFFLSARGAREVILLLFCAVVPLANPYGVSLYKEVLTVASSAATARYIQEWNSPLIFPGTATTFFLGLFVFLLFEFRRQYPLRLLIPSVLFFLMFLKSLRMGPLFLVVAMPLLFVGCDEALRRVGERSSNRWMRRIGVAGGALVFIWFAIVAVSYHPFPFPKDAVEVLRERVRMGEQIVLFNDYGWGGYLIMHAPEIPVFIDGRMPHWVDTNGSSAMKDYLSIAQYEREDAWYEALSRRGVNTVLLKHTSKDAAGKENRLFVWIAHEIGKSGAVRNVVAALSKGGARNIEALLREKGWKKLWEDDVALVLTAP